MKGIVVTFYEKYVALCNGHGKSPSGAALEMGLSKTSVNRWKKGGGITDATILKVANYFHITVAELMGDESPVLPEESAKKAPDPKTEGEDSKVSRAINFVRGASPDEINEIENFFAYLESKRKNNETKS